MATRDWSGRSGVCCLHRVKTAAGTAVPICTSGQLFTGLLVYCSVVSEWWREEGSSGAQWVEFYAFHPTSQKLPPTLWHEKHNTNLAGFLLRINQHHTRLCRTLQMFNIVIYWGKEMFWNYGSAFLFRKKMYKSVLNHFVLKTGV